MSYKQTRTKLPSFQTLPFAWLWPVLLIPLLCADMALTGQDFDEAASDRSRRCIHQLFAATGGGQI